MEGRKLTRFPHWSAETLQLLAACGVTAFFTSWTGYVVIANLSALAHQLLGQAKTCVILLAGHVFFHNPLSEPQVTHPCPSLSVFSSFYFIWVF